MALQGFGIVKLVFFVFLWYFFNVRYNVANKKALRSLDAPVTIAWMQMAFGIILSACIWLCRCFPVPELSKADIRKLIPTSVVFAIAQAATVVALSQGNVSLTHAVKSLEPVVNAVVSAIILNQCLHPVVYSTLAPIIMGVGMTSAAHFKYSGSTMFFAMVSNVCFAIRNVLAKKTGNAGNLGEGPITKKTNQLAIITIMASVVELPFVLVMSGGFTDIFKAWSHAIEGGADPAKLSLNLFESCLHFTMYQVSSFWVLSCVQPVTHSVLNSLKRVAVILAACVFLGETLTPTGMFGVALATLGAIMYSIAKQTCTDAAPPAMLGKSDLHKLAGAITFVFLAGGLCLASSAAIRMSLPQYVRLDTATPTYTGFFGDGGMPHRHTLESVEPPVVPVALVQVPAFRGCGGRVHQLTCLKTVISTGFGGLRWNQSLREPLCQEVLRLGGWTGKTSTKDLESAHVGVCVQHAGLVGVAAVLDKHSGFARALLPQEIGSATTQLDEGSYRIVSRKRVLMPAKYPNSPVPLNFRRGHRTAFNQAMKLDTNLGNFVWMYGATRMMNPYTTITVRYEQGQHQGDQFDAVNSATANLFHIPEGNDTIPGAIRGYTGYLNNMIQAMNLPSMMMGVGIQAEIPSNQDMDTTLHQLQLNQIHVDLLNTLAAHARIPSVTVRGKLTSGLCEKAGIHICVPLGCPSFTINRNRSLGDTLQLEWRKLASKISNSEPIRIAMYLPAYRPQKGNRTAFDEDAYSLFLKLYSNHDGFFILQSHYDYDQLKQRIHKSNLTFNLSRVKFFNDLTRWKKNLRTVDFVIGCRIHGNMAAVAAGRPSLLIPTDLRIMEMAEAMKLPHIPLGELNASDFDLPKTIQSVNASFDFNGMEKTRISAIRTYKEILNDAGLEIHPELELIGS